jgi:hypothetical protein
MTKDEALRLALEALELHGKQYPHMVKGYCIDAITAIKAALEAKDEKLLEENERLHVENRRLIDRIETIGVPIGVGGFATTTSTPPQRTWVGLTYEEQRELYKKHDMDGWGHFYNAIEAKLKEKNT